MPVSISGKLPAAEKLFQENPAAIWIEEETRPDNRALNIAILNLMPAKEETELNLLRVLSASPLHVRADFVRTKSYFPRTVDSGHLFRFYLTPDEVRHRQYDGMIFTGAPVEHLEFQEVAYWKELQDLMDWAKAHVESSLFICWAAQAALFHHFGIQKFPLEKKLSGVFDHSTGHIGHPILQGFSTIFQVPHSRYTAIRREDIESHPDLQLLSWSAKAGVHLAESKKVKGFFMTGHPEYDAHTLGAEYWRDKARAMDTGIPVNYFPMDDPTSTPVASWRSHADLFFANWLQFFVNPEAAVQEKYNQQLFDIKT